MNATLTTIPVDAIDPSPDQNRTEFDPVALRELADSIRESGLWQPVKVRPIGDRWALMFGERRLRACRDILGWSTIPALVDSDDHERLEYILAALGENIIRDNPGPLEEARGLSDALAYEVDAAELARKLGKSARWVRGRLALLALADDVAHYVATGALPIERGILMAELDVNRQRLALQAHQTHMTSEAFRALVARLLTEQSEESMFDAEAFLRLEEYVIDAEESASAKKVRETPLGFNEIAQLLEVKPQTVRVWQHRKLLPLPDGRVSGNPFWWETTVVCWAKKTDRMPDE